MSCARAVCPGLDPASPSGAVLVAFMLSRAPSGGKLRRPDWSISAQAYGSQFNIKSYTVEINPRACADFTGSIQEFDVTARLLDQGYDVVGVFAGPECATFARCSYQNGRGTDLNYGHHAGDPEKANAWQDAKNCNGASRRTPTNTSPATIYPSTPTQELISGTKPPPSCGL